MATLVPFIPSLGSVFQFNPTLDGTVYLCRVPWNFFGQRFYIDLQTLAGESVLYRALVASPLGYDIDLINGYFQTSTLVFRDSTQNFEIGP